MSVAICSIAAFLSRREHTQNLRPRNRPSIKRLNTVGNSAANNIQYSESNIFDDVSKFMDILSNFADFMIFGALVPSRIGLSEIADHYHYFA